MRTLYVPAVRSLKLQLPDESLSVLRSPLSSLPSPSLSMKTRQFASPASPSALLTQPWCKALDAERAEKRQGQKLGGEFDACPKLSEISIVPTDADANGRFETLRLIADPYVAGPYAEGNYKVDLPVTPTLVAALKPEYLASFEVQRQ